MNPETVDPADLKAAQALEAETVHVGGAEAAAEAAEQPTEEPAETIQPADLVALVESVLSVVVALAAQGSAVPPAKLETLSKLNPTERAVLELTAPHAARYVGAVGSVPPWLGALAFAGVAAFAVRSRLRQLAPAEPTPQPLGAMGPEPKDPFDYRAP